MIDMLMSRFFYMFCWKNKVVIILIILSASMAMLITLSYHSNKHPSTMDEVLRSGKGHISLSHLYNRFKHRKGDIVDRSPQNSRYRASRGGFQGQHVQRKFLEKNQVRFNVLKEDKAAVMLAAGGEKHVYVNQLHNTAPQGRVNVDNADGHEARHNKTRYKAHSAKLVDEENPSLNIPRLESHMHPIIGGPNVMLHGEVDISQMARDQINKEALEEIPFEKPAEVKQRSDIRFQRGYNTQQVARHYGSSLPATVNDTQSLNKIINQRIVEMKSILRSDETTLRDHPAGVPAVYPNTHYIPFKHAHGGVLQPMPSHPLKIENAANTEEPPRKFPMDQVKKLYHNRNWWGKHKQMVSYLLHSKKPDQPLQNAHISQRKAQLEDGLEKHDLANEQQIMNSHRYRMEHNEELKGNLPRNLLPLKKKNRDMISKHPSEDAKQGLSITNSFLREQDLHGEHQLNWQNNLVASKQIHVLPSKTIQFPTRPSTNKIIAVEPPTINVLNNNQSQANIASLIIALARQRKPVSIFSPHHASEPYRQPDVWPELLAMWTESVEKYCDGHLIVINNEFAMLKDVIIDRNFCHGRNGGEEIHEVLNQPEDEEYYTYFPGFFQLSCKVTKPEYFFNNNNHLNQWLYSLNIVRDEHLYSEMRQEFTIAIVRYEYANLYHTTTDFYNAFLLMEYYNKTQVKTNILIIDGHPKGALDPVWDVLFNSSRRIDKQSTRTKYSQLVWSIVGYNSPLMDHYATNIPLLEEFRTFFLSSYKIKDQRKLVCDKINILFIWRRDYIAHPRNPSGSISRKIQNEQELVDRLRKNFPLFSIKGIQIDLFEMDQQLAFISETDILIGMHGAGLTHAIFLPKHAGMIELLPTYWSAANEHFRAIARWRHLHYRQWVNVNPMNEAPNHYTKIPPEVLNNLVDEMAKVLCGLAPDTPNVIIENQ